MHTHIYTQTQHERSADMTTVGILEKSYIETFANPDNWQEKDSDYTINAKQNNLIGMSKIQSQITESNPNAKQRIIMITPLDHKMAGWCKIPTNWHIKAVDYFAVGWKKGTLTINKKEATLGSLRYMDPFNTKQTLYIDYHFPVTRRGMSHVSLI